MESIEVWGSPGSGTQGSPGLPAWEDVERLLHNTVASMKSRVDLTRGLVRSWPFEDGWVEGDYQRRVDELVSHDVVPFFHELRNYILHHRLVTPTSIIQVQAVPGLSVVLSTGELLDHGWSSASVRGLPVMASISFWRQRCASTWASSTLSMPGWMRNSSASPTASWWTSCGKWPSTRRDIRPSHPNWCWTSMPSQRASWVPRSARGPRPERRGCYPEAGRRGRILSRAGSGGERDRHFGAIGNVLISGGHQVTR